MVRRDSSNEKIIESLVFEALLRKESAMSQSSLVTKQWWADPSNYTKGRQDTIRGIVIHHAASTSLDSVGQVFSTPGRNGSAHYGVCAGQVHQYVREEDTAWHCGNWLGNSATVGIECINSTGAPDWKVSDATIQTVIKLVADIAKRNNLGKLWLNPDADYPTLSGHRDWYGSATYCPGDYLYSKLQYIADKANEINYPPAKAELKWSKLAKVTIYKCAKQPTYLYGFNHTHATNVEKIKNFDKGELIEIYGKVENKTIGRTYLLTEYSYTKKIANGFLEADMEKYEPQAESDIVTVPEEGASGNVEDNPRGLTDFDYSKTLQEFNEAAKTIEDKAKEQKIMIPMSNKVYDILKIVAIVILPLISATYIALSKIWGFGFGAEIDQTIQIIIAAINTVLGLALVKSSSDYHKNDK